MCARIPKCVNKQTNQVLRKTCLGIDKLFNFHGFITEDTEYEKSEKKDITKISMHGAFIQTRTLSKRSLPLISNVS